jgi:lipopolysaccharide transport system permease protein
VARIPGRHFLRNLVERRALVAQLVRRDFRTHYVGSAAGWLWGVVHPIVQLLIWIMVFKYWFKVALLPGEVTTNYPVFLFCGILPWWLFQETVTRSAGSLVEQSNLITRTVFPSEVVPVSIFLSSMIHHLIAVGLVILTVGVWLKTISPMIVLLPVYMFFVGLLAIGVGWVVSSLHVYLRDTGQAMGVIINLWFWITPIMISEQGIPEPFRALVRWNPMSWVVNAYRYRLLSSQWPDWRELAVIAAYSISVFVLGGLFFRHLKRGFADVL